MSSKSNNNPMSKKSSVVRKITAISISAGVPNFFLRSVSWVCSIGGFLFGYSASVINGSLIFMERELGLDSLTKGVVTSSIIVGAAIGALIGGRLADRFGRKRVMICLDILFIIGALSTTLAPNFWLLVPFRAILGFAAGGHSSVGPVFLAEISTAESRSQAVTLNSLFIVIGELVAFIVNAVLGNVFWKIDAIWRWMNAVVVAPAVLLLICHCALVPESPRWLAGDDQLEQAYSTLRQLRKTTAQTDREFREIHTIAGKKKGAAQQNDKDGSAEEAEYESIGFLAILCTKWVRTLFLVGIGIAITQQLCGISIAMYYGTEVLRNAGMDDKIALIANISIGVISCASTWLSLFLINRLRRRRMLIWGLIGAVGAHLLIAACAQFIPEGPARAWTILGCILIFLFFFQASISPVTWLLLAEIFPLDIRGIGMGLTTLVAMVTNCVEGLVFPLALEHIGYPITFSILAIFGFFSLIFVWIFLPETRHKSLEQLEGQFQVGDWSALKEQGENPRKKRSLASLHRTLSKIVEDEEEKY